MYKEIGIVEENGEFKAFQWSGYPEPDPGYGDSEAEALRNLADNIEGIEDE